VSLTKDALQHIEQSHKTGTAILNGEAMILGDQFSITDLEKYHEGRRRFRGKFATEGMAAFTRYVGERTEANTPVFIDRDAMAARCYLDIGDPGAPGHCDHVATLTLPKTPEYEAFLRANGSTFDQQAMVELIEDWGHLMTFRNSAEEELPLSKALTAFRKVSLDDLTKVESEQQAHSSQASIMSSVSVNNAERLPATIEWRLTPYEELQSRTLRMRVATLTEKAEKPRFRLRAIALEHEQQDIAQEFAGQLNVELAGCECLLGTFSP